MYVVQVNTFHARCEQTTSYKIHKRFKNVKILEFDNFWNHHEKCIQISTNMPGIGLESCEILEIRGAK